VSDWTEKLAEQPRSRGDKAQATRKQLLARWGSKQVDAGTIVINSIGGRELWMRVGSSGDVFEQEQRS
jgi:hypothetical protein